MSSSFGKRKLILTLEAGDLGRWGLPGTSGWSRHGPHTDTGIRQKHDALFIVIKTRLKFYHKTYVCIKEPDRANQ